MPIVEEQRPKWIQFQMCDLPSTSLGKIARMLGAIDVEKLTFQSYKNLSFSLERHHLEGFENLKYLVLSSNNVSYVNEDLLTGLTKLTGLNLRENNLHLSSGFFNHTPGLQWLELGDNDLRSLKRGTFDNLKNLTLLNLWKNHLTELQPGVFDKLVSLQTLDLNANNLNILNEHVFAKLGKLKVVNLSRNNFTHLLPSNLLRNNTKLQTVSLFDNKQNMTTLPDGFFANLTELKVLKLKKNGFIRLPEDLFWGSSSLTNISLDRNYLITLPALIFRDSKHLLELGLNFNSLERLPDNIFFNASRLNRLDLSKNRFTSISRCVFSFAFSLYGNIITVYWGLHL
jgi:Leucine-rich repeat (LRR) protein